MAEVKLSYKPIAGTVLDPDGVTRNLSSGHYDAVAATHESISAVNGWLASDNLDGSWEVGPRDVKNDAFTSGKMVGSTDNVDFFWDVFPTVTAEDATSICPDFQPTGLTAQTTTTNITGPDGESLAGFLPIPGACISFFLPYKAVVIFTWQISAANARRQLHGVASNYGSLTSAGTRLSPAWEDGSKTQFRLIINSHRTPVGSSGTVSAESAGYASDPQAGPLPFGGAPDWQVFNLHVGGREGPGKLSSRVWSGHFVWGVNDMSAQAQSASTAVAPGWHSAGIYLNQEGYLDTWSYSSEPTRTALKNEGQPCTRVRCRNFKYIAIRVE